MILSRPAFWISNIMSNTIGTCGASHLSKVTSVIYETRAGLPDICWKRIPQISVFPIFKSWEKYHICTYVLLNKQIARNMNTQASKITKCVTKLYSSSFAECSPLSPARSHVLPHFFPLWEWGSYGSQRLDSDYLAWISCPQGHLPLFVF